MFAAFALRVRTNRSAAVGTFLPGDAQPVQVVDHGIDEFWTTALGIEIFVAENQRSTAFPCSLGGDPECPRVADVEEAGGGRSDPTTVAFGMRFDGHDEGFWTRLSSHNSRRGCRKLCGRNLQHGSSANMHEA